MDWKFKENAEPVNSGEFWYDLTDGGYIKPSALLSDEEQIKQLSEAISLIISFKIAAERAELLIEQ